MVALNELFEVTYGNKLDANKLPKMRPSSGGINFVGRSSQNHGVSTTVAPIPGTEPYAAGLITVALGGSKLLSAFVQERAFYTAQNVAVLKPIPEMSFQQKLYMCLAIRHNRFRYSAFGREANRTLRTLDVPDIAELPSWIPDPKQDRLTELERPASTLDTPGLNTATWKVFRYDEIFEIKKGYYNKKPPNFEGPGGIPFIGATDKRNGITAFISYANLVKYSRDGTVKENEPIERKLFRAPSITVSNNGSVGEAFFQPQIFTCTHDVNPLYLKDRSVKLTPALALFICAVIRTEKYRWGYGRKWRPIRMPSSLISLPAAPGGTPDWRIMESYIQSLPYSSQLGSTE
jgi:hypothetical protein